MHRRHSLFLIAAFSMAVFALTTGCSRRNDGQSAAGDNTAGAAVEAKNVAAADGYGPEGGGVNAVAFWTHPTLPFAGMLIAATNNGLESFNIENGDPVGNAPVKDASAIAVFYEGEGPTAQGYAVALTKGGYEIFAIDNISRALNPINAPMTGRPANSFCLARRNGSEAIIELSAEKISARPIEIIGDTATIGEARKIADLNAPRACFSDPRNSALFIISNDGAIRRFDDGSDKPFGVALPSGLKVGAVAAAFNMGAENAETAAGQIAILNDADGVIRLFDETSGELLGAVKVSATFDLDAVTSANAIAIGSANFGGVYRDGLLAIVTKGEGAQIRLVPWNAVMDALGEQLGGVFNPREPHGPQPDAPLIDIKIKQP